MPNKPSPPLADTGRVPDPAPCCTPRRRGRPSRDAVAMPREDILRRAFTAFARDGYDNVSLRSLGNACGVSDSLLTHHFGSKQQLWREATDSTFMPVYERLLALLDALAKSGDAATTLRNNLPQAIKLMAAQPVVVQFLFREGEGDDERGEYLRETYLRPYLARLDVLFDQARDTGIYREVSPASRHALVMGLLRSLVIPGALRAELAPHLATPAAMNAYIDDAVAILYEGLMVKRELQNDNTPDNARAVSPHDPAVSRLPSAAHTSTAGHGPAEHTP